LIELPTLTDVSEYVTTTYKFHCFKLAYIEANIFENKDNLV